MVRAKKHMCGYISLTHADSVFASHNLKFGSQTTSLYRYDFQVYNGASNSKKFARIWEPRNQIPEPLRLFKQTSKIKVFHVNFHIQIKTCISRHTVFPSGQMSELQHAYVSCSLMCLQGLLNRKLGSVIWRSYLLFAVLPRPDKSQKPTLYLECTS